MLDTQKEVLKTKIKIELEEIFEKAITEKMNDIEKDIHEQAAQAAKNAISKDIEAKRVIQEKKDKQEKEIQLVLLAKEKEVRSCYPTPDEIR